MYGRAGQLAVGRQGPLNDESARPFGPSAGVGNLGSALFGFIDLGSTNDLGEGSKVGARFSP